MPRVYPFPHKNNSVRTIWTPYPEDTVSRGRTYAQGQSGWKACGKTKKAIE